MKNISINNKIRFLSVFSLIAYLLLIISMLDENIEDFKMGFEMGYNAAKYKQDNTDTNVYYLTLQTKRNILDFPHTLSSTSANETIAYRPRHIKAKAPTIEEKPRQLKLYNFASSLLAFIIIGILIYLPLGIRKLLLNFKRGHFFHIDNVKRLGTLGKLLISVFAALCFLRLIEYKTLITLFEFENYNIVKESPNYTWLICGLIFLIFSETIKYGIAIKQENDLTI